jgi:hypothetical protein
LRLRQEKSWRVQAGLQFVPLRGSASGERVQASVHHSKQDGRELEWKVLVHWVRLASKASFLNSAKLQVTAVLASVTIEISEVRPGKAEPYAAERSSIVGRWNCMVDELKWLKF